MTALKTTPAIFASTASSFIQHIEHPASKTVTKDLGDALNSLNGDQAQNRLSGQGGAKKDADKLGDAQTDKDLITAYQAWATAHPKDPLADFAKMEAHATGIGAKDLQAFVSLFTTAQAPSQHNSGHEDDGQTQGATGIATSGSTSSVGFQNYHMKQPTAAEKKYLADPQNPKLQKGDLWQANKDFTLYPSGIPSPTDIDQHEIGDCGLESTMASWAQQDPAAIQRAITATGKKSSDGSPIYNVKMYDPSGKPVTIAVNADSEVDSKKGNATTTGADGKGDWALILQKAYAKYRDVYGGVNGHIDGGSTEGMNRLGGVDQIDAMEAFTGVPGKWTANSSSSLVSNIGDGLKNHDMVVANSIKDFTIDGVNLPGGHSWTVESIDSAHSTVTVRNPWGVSGDSKHTDGVYTMSLNDFKKYFSGVDIGQEKVDHTMSKKDVASGTQSAFSTDADNMKIDGGASHDKGVDALRDQALAAAKAGDLTAFKNADTAILAVTGSSEDPADVQVRAELQTLMANTQWNKDPSSGSISENIQHAADALGSGDWKSGANPADVKTFIDDFNNHLSTAILNKDAQAIAGDLRNKPLANNLSSMVNEALQYASSHSGTFAQAPDKNKQNSLIDGFNKAAGAAGAGSFTSNIQDGWAHIKNDMSANNMDHLEQDLQWMLDHISGHGDYNKKEQPVVDAVNDIAKAYGLKLDQPKPEADDNVPFMMY